MTPAVAKLIAEMATADGIDIELREDYSGKFMYGSTTAAIITNNIGEFAAMAVRAAVEKPEMADDIITDLNRLRQDSMGRSSIILY